MKMYLAKVEISAMFIADEKYSRIITVAEDVLRNEIKNNSIPHISVKEIDNIEDVPLNWRGSNLWNADEDISPEDFLKDKLKFDPEYQQYLILKEKFKNLE